MKTFEPQAEFQQIHVSKGQIDAPFIESLHPRSHSNKIAKNLRITSQCLQMDGQCRYCLIARGDATFYVMFPSRLATEKIWDHAAGSLLVKEAGGNVVDTNGEELDFSGQNPFGNGLVLSNSDMFNTVLGVVEMLLYPATQRYTITIKMKEPPLPETLAEILCADPLISLDASQVLFKKV